MGELGEGKAGRAAVLESCMFAVWIITLQNFETNNKNAHSPHKKGWPPLRRGAPGEELRRTWNFWVRRLRQQLTMSALRKRLEVGASSALQLTRSTSNEPMFLSPWALWQGSFLAGSTLIVGAAVLVLDGTCIVLLSWAYGFESSPLRVQEKADSAIHSQTLLRSRWTKS
jgi:hypothetical protein